MGGHVSIAGVLLLAMAVSSFAAIDKAGNLNPGKVESDYRLSETVQKNWDSFRLEPKVLADYQAQARTYIRVRKGLAMPKEVNTYQVQCGPTSDQALKPFCGLESEVGRKRISLEKILSRFKAKTMLVPEVAQWVADANFDELKYVPSPDLRKSLREVSKFEDLSKSIAKVLSKNSCFSGG
jgi:hypothetical protein